MTNEDRCYECTGYGDDYYWDEEAQEYVRACDDCPFNEVMRLEKVISIDANSPHAVSEVICVKCGKRWISVRPEKTLLKHLECVNCGQGYVIETGQKLDVKD